MPNNPHNSRLTQRLADAQGFPTLPLEPSVSHAVVFSLYTEQHPNLLALVSRYFDGATIYPYAFGLWPGGVEHTAVIEIVGTMDDLQRIVHMAGDIKTVNAQTSVLVTWVRLDGRLDV